MQRVFTVKYSIDGEYVLSGSDDMNIRIWKTTASQQHGILLPWEKQKQDYECALIDRYQCVPHIQKIVKKRFIPKPIFTATKLRRTIHENMGRKLQNVIAHNKSS